MANEIRIHTSVEVLQDVGGSAGDEAGHTYVNLQHDGNADFRSWGGSYALGTRTYADAAVAYWKNVVVDTTSADGLENGNAFESNSAVTDGTLPGTVYAIAVERPSTLGTVATVSITVSGEILARLAPGEGVVIPLEMGEAIADCKIHASAYSDGTNEATVNVLVVGVA
tara:strand:+ start:2613 stop:3119 length:507 start_codon:yes stop_codon:yes gene_type:complete